MADSRLLVGLILSLLLSSMVISMIVGGTYIELTDYDLYEPVKTNFSDVTTTAHYENPTISLGDWARTDKGLVSNSKYENVVYFVNLWPKTGEFDNTYLINNPQNLDYRIIIRKSDMFFDSLYLLVADDKLCLQSGSLLGYVPFDACKDYSTQTSMRIRTFFTEDPLEIKVYVDDELVITANDKIPKPFILSWMKRQYAGIIVQGAGLEVVELESTGKDYSTTEDTISVTKFISSLLGVLAWYSDPSGNVVVDLFINLIIKIQQLGIVVFILTLIRGN